MRERASATSSNLGVLDLTTEEACALAGRWSYGLGRKPKEERRRHIAQRPRKDNSQGNELPTQKNIPTRVYN